MTSSDTDRRHRDVRAAGPTPRSRRRLPQPVLVSAPGESELIQHGLRASLAPFAARVRLLETTPGCGVADADVVLYDCFPQRQVRPPAVGCLPMATKAVTVAYSWHYRPDLVRWALDHGFAGYLSKALTADELVSAVEALGEGRPIVRTTNGDDSDLAERSLLVEAHGLTPRESEVLNLVCSGLRNTEIAEQMNLSPNSVKSYIRSAYRRIGATSRSQAVLWGIEHGFGESR
jgi:NarL family two-component system response regulator LiaR